jgi:hypothetical protein
MEIANWMEMMRKFKVIFTVGSELFEEEVRAENFTCPDNSVKFYVDERLVAYYKNMVAIAQLEGQLERTEKEKQEDLAWEGKKKLKKNEKEEDPFATFK